jgi:hypothetical protein
MFDRVLMHIIQTGQVGSLKGEFGFPKVVPNLASSNSFKMIDPFGSLLVKNPKHLRQAFRRVCFFRRVRAEVIVVGKYCPRLQPPIELLRDSD